MVKDIRDMLLMLRQDALDRGMQELALAYGWSAIRIGMERLLVATNEFRK